MSELKHDVKFHKAYFTLFEKLLWSTSIVLIIGTYIMFKGDYFLSLVASIIGATAILFGAKGNAIGPMLMVIFSILYGVISYRYSYYGEMVTYLGMTGPMSLISVVSWFRHPHKKEKLRVQIEHIKKSQVIVIGITAIFVTVGFYFILKLLGTSNLLASTISVTTSYVAVYLSILRSPYFSLAYVANDLVLIILWSLAVVTDRSYISVIVCFVVFAVNDFYAYINWKKLRSKQ